MSAEMIMVMPFLTLLSGVLILTFMRLTGEDGLEGTPWWICFLVIGISLAQEAIVSRMPGGLALKGSLLIDHSSHFCAVMVLFLSLNVLVNIRYENWAPRLDLGILLLLATFFGMVAGAANNWVLVLLAFIGVYWCAHCVMMCDSIAKDGARTLQIITRRSLFFVLIGMLIMVFMFLASGHIQLDELDLAIAKPQQDVKLYLALEGLLALFFIGSMGLSPWFGVFAKTPTSWSAGFGGRFLIALVGFSCFARWSVTIFTRPGLESSFVEPVLITHWPLFLRVVSTIALILIPLLALTTTGLRRSLQILIANPFALALFGISFCSKDLMALSYATAAGALLSFNLVVSALLMVSAPLDTQLKDLVGWGRQQPVFIAAFLLALAALAGLAPFIGSVLVLAAHRVSGLWSLALILNTLLLGLLFARWTAFAFQKTPETHALVDRPTWKRVWLAAQFAPFLFLGIYWKPLFRYGVFTIKNFFE